MAIKKRSECFVGIHFDFHANDDCTEIGKTTTPEMIEQMVDIIRPDYVQCDCKGHRGLSSYPTKVAYPAPGFVKDNLRIWRDVTAAKNVPLFMHYSGVWDTEAIKHHPEWARINEFGEIDPNNTSVFGPYVDELLIPQIKELIDEYNVDGIWVDGECWATCQDYAPIAIEEFKKTTGIENIPISPDDDYFYEYTQFCREAFRKYLKHYVDEIHSYNSEFQIASNWAYSSFMPEKPTIDVDYISGDYTLIDSYNSARLEARCMAPQGKPWDLMAWSFCSQFREGAASTKSIPQLKQEAAAVLAMGGGFQAYFKQKRDGSINLWEMKLMGETADFCRERKAYCHKAVPIPQVAILNSTYNDYKMSKRIFSNWSGEMTSLHGILNNLLDNQYSAEILSEHHLDGKMNKYPIIIIPEIRYFEDEFKAQLLQYAKEGGSLMIIGPVAAQEFADEAGVELVNKISDDIIADAKLMIKNYKKPLETVNKPEGYYIEQWLQFNEWMAGFKSLSADVKPKENTKTIGRLYPQNDNAGEYRTAATIAEYGKGKICAVWFNMGERYVNGATSLSRDFLGGLVEKLFPAPMVKLKGSHYVDVSINTLDDTLLIHLINTSGPHGNNKIYVFDEILSVGPVTLEIKLDSKPKSVTLQPENKNMPVNYNDGILNVVLDRLEIYDILVIKK